MGVKIESVKSYTVAVLLYSILIQWTVAEFTSRKGAWLTGNIDIGPWMVGLNPAFSSTGHDGCWLESVKFYTVAVLIYNIMI